MADITLNDGTLTVHLPGATALRIDITSGLIAVDGASTAAYVPGPRWRVRDLRGGTYGDFHRLRPADECLDADCVRSGQHAADLARSFAEGED